MSITLDNLDKVEQVTYLVEIVHGEIREGDFGLFLDVEANLSSSQGRHLGVSEGLVDRFTINEEGKHIVAPLYSDRIARTLGSQKRRSKPSLDGLPFGIIIAPEHILSAASRVNFENIIARLISTCPEDHTVVIGGIMRTLNFLHSHSKAEILKLMVSIERQGNTTL